MTEAEIRKIIRDEIRVALQVISSGATSKNTVNDEDIASLFPGLPTLIGRPIMHPFGFVSRAPKGTISVTAQQGDHPGNKMTLGHRYANPPSIAEGESAVYTSDGTIIKLKKNGEIEITSTNKVTVTSALVEMSQNVHIKGNLQVDGNIDVGGNANIGGNAVVAGNVTAAKVISQGGVTAAGPVAGSTIASAGTDLDTLKDTYNLHTHPENGTGGGTTSPPNQQV